MPKRQTSSPRTSSRGVVDGGRVRLQREARSWSQMELAYRAKISQAKLSGIETGSSRSGVRADTLRDLALALGVPSDYLLGLTDRAQPYPPAETDRV